MHGRHTFAALQSGLFVIICNHEGRGEASIPDPPKRRYDAKERPMASIKSLTTKLAAWRRYRDAVRELSQLSDHELGDIGLHRGEIESVARKTARV